MGHRVLGMTLHDDVVRVAVVETRLRSFELDSVWEFRREPAAQPEEGGEGAPVPRARAWDLLERALVPAPSKLDSVALSCPGDIGFVRRIGFPFKEPGRITAALPFQMIGHVPVRPEDIHCTFERVAVEGGTTEVLAVAVPNEEFGEFLASVRSEGLDPVHMTLDGVCLASLLPFVPDLDEGARMLVWAEGDHADLMVAQGNRPVLVRSVSVGEAVVQGSEASPAFMREVLMTMAGASENGTSVTNVKVAGPGAAVLAGPLAEVLGVKCEVLDPAAMDIPGSEGCDGLNPSMTLAVAVALAAASGGGPGSMNLMTGEYSREGGHGLLRENFRYFAIVLAIFAALGITRTTGRFVGLQAERDELVSEMRSLSKVEMGEASEDFDGVLRKMKTRSLQKTRIFPAWTGVDTVNRLMSAVTAMGKADGELTPGDQGDGSIGFADGAWAVEVESVKVEPKQLSVRGEANTIETLDGLVSKLKTDPCFHEVVTESTERIQFRRHQGWQRFSIRLEVDCGGTGSGTRVASGK